MMEIKKVKTELCREDIAYCTDDQSVEIKYAFAKKEGDTYVEQFPGITCRGTTSLALWCTHFGYDMESDVYGLQAVDLEDKDEDLLMILRVYDSGPLLKNFYILNELEDIAGVPHSTISQDEDCVRYLVIHSPIMWKKSPVLYSLYGLILRCLCYDDDAYSDLNPFHDFDSFWNAVGGMHWEDSDTVNHMDKHGLSVRTLLENYSYIFENNPFTLINDEDFNYTFFEYPHDCSNVSYRHHDRLQYTSLDLCGLSHTGVSHFFTMTDDLRPENYSRYGIPDNPHRRFREVSGLTDYWNPEPTVMSEVDGTLGSGNLPELADTVLSVSREVCSDGTEFNLTLEGSN